MKTTNGPRFRISALIALMLSFTILVANPIPSAFAGLNLHFSTPTLTRAIPPKPILKKVTLLCIKGKRVLKVIGIAPKCPTGYKKSPTPKPTPTPTPKPTPTSPSNGSYVDSSGTYIGTSNFPNLTPPGDSGCVAQVLQQTITLQEASGGKITGNAGGVPLAAGTRVGNTITVTLQTNWGPRGPYIWQLNGNTLTGIKQALCIDDVTNTVTAEGVQSFTVTRSLTPTSTPTPTSNGSNVDSSGTYTGTKSYQNLTGPGCAASGVLPVSITLLEASGGKITGNAGNGNISGTRVGSTITVTDQSTWGPRGPFVWQLNGKTITGTWPVFCVDDITNALTGEVVASLTMTRP